MLQLINGSLSGYHAIYRDLHEISIRRLFYFEVCRQVVRPNRVDSFFSPLTVIKMATELWISVISFILLVCFTLVWASMCVCVRE